MNMNYTFGDHMDDTWHWRATVTEASVTYSDDVSNGLGRICGGKLVIHRTLQQVKWKPWDDDGDESFQILELGGLPAEAGYDTFYTDNTTRFIIGGLVSPIRMPYSWGESKK